ncbi:MAG TPA: non-heme iron oxygenase ferredoxin subunit [Chloroflexi bacterium]|nr:non-heme iron oxygenase ferredoxin subunit [Chloroflexota bacterium]
MANFVKVAETSELPPGERMIVEVDGLFIALFNVNGEIYAIEDICTHDDGPLAEGELYGYEIECPRHGARFDIRDGRVLRFPAVTPITSFEVRVEGEDILINVEDVE